MNKFPKRENLECSDQTTIFGVIKSNGKNQGHVEYNEGRWTKNEHQVFISQILKCGIKNWKKVT